MLLYLDGPCVVVFVLFVFVTTFVLLYLAGPCVVLIVLFVFVTTFVQHRDRPMRVHAYISADSRYYVGCDQRRFRSRQLVAQILPTSNIRLVLLLPE